MVGIQNIINNYLKDNLELERFNINYKNQDLIDAIRNKYSKFGEIRSKNIGTHPDYAHCEDREEMGHAITLFADIAGSTKMSANLAPRKVLRLRKLILNIFSQTIIALDGHVHRLQGDGVMAFFNWNNMKHSQSIWNALFAAMEILYIVKEILSPFIESEIKKVRNIPNSIAVRIGIDYGNKESVIWSKLGYEEKNNRIFSEYTINEHTAIGVNVDLASKIQNKVKKNTIGLGENVYNKIQLDEKYLEVNVKEKTAHNFIIENPHYSYKILKNQKLSDDLFNFSHDVRKFRS